VPRLDGRLPCGRVEAPGWGVRRKVDRVKDQGRRAFNTAARRPEAMRERGSADPLRGGQDLSENLGQKLTYGSKP